VRIFPLLILQGSISNAKRFLSGNKKRSPQDHNIAVYDHLLVQVIIALMLFGLVMVYSASIALPDASKYSSYTNTHFLVKQTIFICISLLASLVTFQIPMVIWQRYAPSLFITTLVLLTLVLLPRLGHGVNGAKRWLSFWMFNLQPSEIMKLFIVLYAANYTVRKQGVMHKLTKGFLPMVAVVGVVGLLLMLEPDLGALGVIVCIAMGILFFRRNQWILVWKHIYFTSLDIRFCYLDFSMET